MIPEPNRDSLNPFELYVVDRLNTTCERLSVVETLHKEVGIQKSKSKIINYLVIPILSGGVITALVQHLLK